MEARGHGRVLLRGAATRGRTRVICFPEHFAGLEKTELMIIDGLGHALPDAKGIETALGTLEKIR